MAKSMITSSRSDAVMANDCPAAASKAPPIHSARNHFCRRGGVRLRRSGGVSTSDRGPAGFADGGRGIATASKAERGLEHADDLDQPGRDRSLGRAAGGLD